jgi:CRP/FNR family transcriptional regulator, cyclic AMP receptor protein
MSDEAVVRALGRSDLFGGLDATELAALAAECRVRRLAKGELVFARGDAGVTMFLVGQGSIALSITSADGGEVVLAVLRPPKTFGELAVIDNGPRVATATARQASLVVSIPGPYVRRLIRSHPSVSETLLTALAGMVRSVDDHASNLVLLDLGGRVAKFLLDQAAGSDGRRPGSLTPVDVRMTQSELARIVGGSRQQVNRIIVALERAGAIHRVGSRIVAISPERLAERSAG